MLTAALTGLLAASPARRAAASLAGAAALLACGFAGGEVWEHRGPTPKLAAWATGQSLKVQRDRALAASGKAAEDARAMTRERDRWRDTAQACESARAGERNEAAGAVAAAETHTTQASSGAFDRGYAAGRTAGRASCGGPDAPRQSLASVPIGEPGLSGRGGAAGGVRLDPADDLAAGWSQSAYRP